MEPSVRLLEFWWTYFWFRTPMLLALLGGTVFAFSDYGKSRRTGSLLGAIGFLDLCFLLVMHSLINPLVLWMTGQGLGYYRVAVGNFLSLVLYVCDAVAIGLLVAAVVMNGRGQGGRS